ncbi:MAG: hypothetical protein UR12_C0016G0001 [candidate division TM6 bacterium GW2011_GWF2_30_66]|jgi:hypothetical protein|nr:MAG: hypothetical protein UR12_C0016G0001 [candidate division TM6 bacterium GW2011_GWF2_30_66]
MLKKTIKNKIISKQKQSNNKSIYNCDTNSVIFYCSEKNVVYK